MRSLRPRPWVEPAPLPEPRRLLPAGTRSRRGIIPVVRTLSVALLSVAALLGGCDLFNPPQEIDLDADGWIAAEDCDDADPEANPGRGEACDGKDNDCDGVIDEGFDEDGDGFLTCGASPDCNDSDPATYPGAPELCNGLDEDCDGIADNGATGNDDADGDGVSACDGDCDDNDPEVYPGATDVCDGKDNDCDGLLADVEQDLDGDGSVGCPGVDCDDSDPAVYPGAPEVCDGDDEDCDGAIDEDFDADGDGFSTCIEPLDCDDGSAVTYPGAPELCDGLDNDCDGGIDEDTADDADGDGWTACGGDCDDTDPDVSPDGLEIPNGVDDDCSGAADDGGYGGVADAGVFPTVAMGSATLDALGARLSNGGDINGDGLSDFVASNPSHSGGSGRAWIYLGTPFALSNAPSSFSHFATVSGGADDALGESVALADLDGDGYSDVVLGVPESNSSSPPSGRVLVFWGSPIMTGGAWPTAAAGVTIVGTFPTEQCGTAVANLGDLNGDGVDDLGFGCPWYDPGQPIPGLRGRTQVFFGRSRAAWAAVTDADDATSSWGGLGQDTRTGVAVAGAGDVNGDLYDDFVIGSPEYLGDYGRVCLVLGGASLPALANFSYCDRTYDGVAGQGAGAWLGGGDHDGDGYSEILVGAPASNSGRGYLAVIRGGPTPWASGTVAVRLQYYVFGDVVTEEAGAWGALADLDGDGVQDLLAPTMGYDGPGGGDQGRVSIFYGPSTGHAGWQTPDDGAARILGEAGGDAFGSTVTGLVDFNGDGAEDVIVGAPWSDLGASAGGALYFVPGFP